MLRVCQQLASTVQNVEQSLLLLVTQATHLSLRVAKSAVLLSLAFCHKHFVVFSRNQHRRLVPAKCHTQLAVRWPWSNGDRVDNTRPVAALTAGRSQIQAQNRDFCLPHLHSTPPIWGFPPEFCYAVWQGKTRMVWLPDSKHFDDMFIRFDRIHERDRHTDRHTDTA